MKQYKFEIKLGECISVVGDTREEVKKDLEYEIQHSVLYLHWIDIDDQDLYDKIYKESVFNPSCKRYCQLVDTFWKKCGRW